MAFYMSPIRNASRRNSQQYINSGAMNPLAMTSQAYLPYTENPPNPPFQADQRKGSFPMTGMPIQGIPSTQSAVQPRYDMTYATVGGTHPVMYGPALNHPTNHSAFTGMYNVPPNYPPVTSSSTMIQGSAINQPFSPSEQVHGPVAPPNPIQYLPLPVALLTVSVGSIVDMMQDLKPAVTTTVAGLAALIAMGSPATSPCGDT